MQSCEDRVGDKEGYFNKSVAPTHSGQPLKVVFGRSGRI